ncbi:hypothetical protein [Litorihabitans aurantiacus]|uniref:Uncharacterized protein n=1 Tax=Litorihabitans aurantiacus TaxID=1930061 RepID=A0AA37UKP7_9MICO|nr:hypothetical protein [Litorihabitans aurantiacus]GMA30730.1 hypothetical protein GCM10025875_07220 [Litorihabitans aurantiacus]
MSRRAEYYEPPDAASFEATASQRNRDKQAGFYVDRAGSSITTPLEITADGVPESLGWIAQVVEMHLIEDHTRQQDTPDASLIDSVQDLHWVMLQYAHPAEFAGFMDQLTEDPNADRDGNGEPTSPTT